LGLTDGSHIDGCSRQAQKKDKQRSSKPTAYSSKQEHPATINEKKLLSKRHLSSH